MFAKSKARDKRERQDLLIASRPPARDFRRAISNCQRASGIRRPAFADLSPSDANSSFLCDDWELGEVSAATCVAYVWVHRKTDLFELIALSRETYRSLVYVTRGYSVESAVIHAVLLCDFRKRSELHSVEYGALCTASLGRFDTPLKRRNWHRTVRPERATHASGFTALPQSSTTEPGAVPLL